MDSQPIDQLIKDFFVCFLNMDKNGIAKHGHKVRLLTAPRLLQGDGDVRRGQNK